ncbi:molybdopterin-dependent oxidoreductase [Chloroflexota bacterium]
MNQHESAWCWEENGMRVVRSIARTGPGCHEGCGVLLHVRDGKLEKVEGDPGFPLTGGRLCPRCLALTEVVYHPDRLKYPLKRVGARGENKWERISWEEAYQTIADKYNTIRAAHGAESVLFCSGTGRDVSPYVTRLAASFGSPNRVSFGPLSGKACYAPKIAMMAAMFGYFAVADLAQTFADRYDNPSWRRPECVIVWGNEPMVSSADGFMGHWLLECMKRGTKLIVIDPRKTWTAARAEIWMQVRPGTDAALALGMLNVIISENLYDADFVRQWTHGFDELRERVSKYLPEDVARITGVPAEQIVAAARLFAKSCPAAVQWGVAIDQSRECINTIHAIIALWTITGNMDVPGGNILRGDLLGVNRRLAEWMGQGIPEAQQAKRSGIGQYPFLDWMKMLSGDAVLDQMFSGDPYPIKASWIQGSNTFACGAADPKRVYQAWKKLDFNVVVDLFMTPTAVALADIVLPAATYPERDGLFIPVGGMTCVGAINRAMEPVGECRSDVEINLELGRRLNPEVWPWRGVRELYDYLLQPSGLTFEELREKGFAFGDFEYGKHEKGLLRPDDQPGFNTPTGKVELYSTVLEQCGLEPLPGYEEPSESLADEPDLARQYPLVLTTGARTWAMFHSEHRQVPSLRRLNPDPLAEIHPETARPLNIADGDWVYLENQYGRCRQKARLTEAIRQGVVSAQHGWWFPEKSASEPGLFGVWESNINLLLPSGRMGKSGLGYPFKAQRCRVYKVGDE